MAKILLITPPLTQFNCAYPATAQLVGYLRKCHLKAEQMDLSQQLIDRLFTSKEMKRLGLDDFTCQWIEPIKRFLQGKDLSLQNRFAKRGFWPLKNMPEEEEMGWNYGEAGTYNEAQLYCTLFLEQTGRWLQKHVSSHFEMVRYGEKLCMSLPELDPLEEALQGEPNQIDLLMLEILEEQIKMDEELTHIGFSVPFPGNLYAAMRCAQYIKRHFPSIKTIMGGGYVNTELRQMTDDRFWQYIDHLILDDGEGALEQLLTNPIADHIIEGSRARVPFNNIGTPCLDGLHLGEYMDTADETNPMARLWTNGRWNKLMIAHGCYWHKCTFCDTSLDYIAHYETATAEEIVDRMEGLMGQSGQSGFHFTDEAAPPMVLKKVAEEIIRRKLCVSYWTNIRFEGVYNNELCYLMAQSGCIAVSGGIEVASERVLKLINKGVSVAQVKKTLECFRDNGIMVHAYLMYGFPTETERELMESLGTVRDLFAEGLIQSAFWHRYAMTCHSETGREPERFHCTRLTSAPFSFANNEVGYRCEGEPDWSRYGRGLNLATQNYMRGVGFEVPILQWFGHREPGKRGKNA